MTIIAVGSIAGSPGATTLAVGLAAAWPDATGERVVVEADPDGGRLGAELGIGVEPGLMALALAVRTADLDATELVRRGAAPVGDWHAVAAPASSEQTHSALVHAATSLAALMGHDPHGGVWIVDAGRLSSRSPALPFAKAADHTVIVSHGSFPFLQLLAHRVDALRSAGCSPIVAIAEPVAWPADEIADFVGADVVATLPRVSGRTGLGAMGASAWRPWWRRVEEAARYLATAADTADRAARTGAHG